MGFFVINSIFIVILFFFVAESEIEKFFFSIKKKICLFINLKRNERKQQQGLHPNQK